MKSKNEKQFRKSALITKHTLYLVYGSLGTMKGVKMHVGLVGFG
jgi:hypothetical protein